MITSWHQGMKHEVPLDVFVMTMRQRTENAQLAYARLRAKSLVSVVREQLRVGLIDPKIATFAPYLTKLAKQYLVVDKYIPLTVARASLMLQGKV